MHHKTEAGIFPETSTWLRSTHLTWILILLVVLLRSPTLLESMYSGDEAYSAAIAADMLHGGTIYQTAVDTRAPFIYYLYYGIFSIAGENNLYMVHWVAILFMVATALAVRSITALIAGPRAGAWAAIGYVVFSHAYLPRDTLGANVEIFTNLPMVLGILCFLLAERDRALARRAAGWLFAGGVFCAIAVFFRLPSLAQLGVIGGYLIYACWIARSMRPGDALRSMGLVLAGFAVFVALVVAYHVARGNWADMVAWAWTVALHYVGAETTAVYVFKRLLLAHGTFIIAGALLWYFGVKQMVALVRTHFRDPSRVGPGFLIMLWFLAGYVTLFIGWRFPGHYHLLLLPPLAILAGIGFEKCVKGLRHLSPVRAANRRGFLLGAAAVPALSFLIMAFLVRVDTMTFTPITDYVRTHTAPGDRIFVWGSAPHIYSFSKRRMASRFASGTHLVGMYASRPHDHVDQSRAIVPGSWDLLRADLRNNTPELIVDLSPVAPNWDAHPMSRYPILKAHLAHYRLEKTIQGVRIYRRTASVQAKLADLNDRTSRYPGFPDG